MAIATAMANTYILMRLDPARPFLRGSFEEIDPSLPRFMSILGEVGAL
jgi:hypothetical protein